MTVEIPPIIFSIEKIPAELKRRRQWICWRYEVRDDKLVKIPLAPWSTGHDGPASVTDPNNMAPFELAVDYARDNGWGIGFCFFSGDGLTGIDLDKLDGEAQEIIKKANSYAEFSPSGKGIHIIVKGKVKKAIKKDVIEVYSENRFFTVTGDHVEGTPLGLNDAQQLLDELEAKYGKKPNAVTVQQKTAPGKSWENYVNKLGYTLREVRQRDRVLDEYLDGGLAGKPSPSEADMGTLERLLFWGYEPDDAVSILEHYRWRKKLLRRDYVEGMLAKLLPVRETAKPKIEKIEPARLPHLNMIEDPNLSNKPVIVEAVVSSNSIAYLTPSEIEATIQDKDGNLKTAIEKIDEKDPLNIKLVGCNEDVKYKRLKRLFGTSKNVPVKEKAWRTVYRVRVRPPVFTLERRGEKIVDERGFEYKAYDIYVTADKPVTFHPSSLVRLEAICVPNPKTQKTTLLAYKVEFPEETCSFNVEKLKKLKAKFQNKTVEERLNWILSNFEKYSQIVGRRNLAEAGFLTFFTPTWVKFNGEVQRGWGNCIFCGDTTTAKSETLRKLIRLLGAGMLITAETASTVGLVGTATQLEKEGWFVDWGFLVLCDRKLLAVDGAHKLSLSNWCVLAEAERSGVVTIAKAAKNSAYARTRQIKIANAIDREADKYTTKTLASFLYPCQALTTILDKTSIARLDLAVFSDSRDVKPEDINKEFDGDYDKDLKLLSEALKWCWSDQAEIKFAEEAVKTLLEEATNLYNDFFCDLIPLASIDLKWKLARLSAALAYMTLSTEDYRTVTVTEDHVKTVVNFIKEEYSKAGLNTLAQQERHEILDVEDVRSIIAKIEADLKEAIEKEKIVEILRYIVHHGRVTRDELKTKFSLAENSELRPFLASLKSEGLIKVSRGFYPEPKLIQAYKVTGGFVF